MQQRVYNTITQIMAIEDNNRCFCCCSSLSAYCESIRDRFNREGMNFIVINPDNPILLCWRFLVHVTRLLSSYTYAYIAALRLHPGLSPWLKNTAPTVFEGMFCIEIILNFMTALRPPVGEDTKAFIRDF